MRDEYGTGSEGIPGIEMVPGSGGGGNGERIRQMDKIIQIATSDATVFGLSESGVLYRMYKEEKYQKIWEKVVESPKE